MSEKVLNGHPCACDEVSTVSDGSIMLATVWFERASTVKLRFVSTPIEIGHVTYIKNVFNLQEVTYRLA